MGDTSLTAMELHGSFDLVVEVRDQHDDSFLVRGLWHDEAFIVEGFSLGPGIWTLYDAIFLGKCDGKGRLTAGPQAVAFRKPEHDLSAFLNVKEVCSGLGGISLGAVRAGCHSQAHLDCSQLSADTLCLNGCTVVQGLLQDKGARRALHAIHPQQPCFFAAGIPCQPYSVQGLGLGLSDQRGQTPFHVFRATWLSQAAALVLKCVATMRALASFAAKLGWQMAQTCLDLGHQWGRGHHRWWCNASCIFASFCFGPLIP